MAKIPYTRSQLIDYLESKICDIIYDTPEGKHRVHATLMESKLSHLDNRPIGFESTREAAEFDPGCINALDVDTNSWVTIPIDKIINLIVP